MAIQQRTSANMLLAFIIFGAISTSSGQEQHIQAANGREAPIVTDAELKASLLDANLLKPPHDSSPISTQTSYFQGDILFKSSDELRQILNDDGTQPQNDAYSSRKWPEAKVPYKLSSSFSMYERKVIVRAIAEFHEKTCIKFIPRTTQSDYVDILKGEGCTSHVGRQGGNQTLSLGNGCVYFGIIIHELMHALGFWHEQSRLDRKYYVTIDWENIIQTPKSKTHNFIMKSKSISQDFGLPYDLDSVMHYGKYYFAINENKPTIRPTENGVVEILGQRRGLSKLDLRGLNLLYGCRNYLEAKPSDGIDMHFLCSHWALKGECKRKPSYMNDFCLKSCKKHGCNPKCQNGATCNARYECDCRPGWKGDSCNIKDSGLTKRTWINISKAVGVSAASVSASLVGLTLMECYVFVKKGKPLHPEYDTRVRDCKVTLWTYPLFPKKSMDVAASHWAIEFDWGNRKATYEAVNGSSCLIPKWYPGRPVPEDLPWRHETIANVKISPLIVYNATIYHELNGKQINHEHQNCQTWAQNLLENLNISLAHQPESSAPRPEDQENRFLAAIKKSFWFFF